MRCLFFILLSFSAHAQISYSGFLGKMAIKLIVHPEDYGSNVPAVYEYEKYDTPITIDGILKKSKKLELYERKPDRSINATLRFNNFSESAKNIQGEWFNSDSTKRLPITLTKDFQIDAGTAKQWEIMQRTSLPTHYFRMIVSKNEYGAIGVTGVKILEKKTDKLIQTIDGLECQYLGLDNINVADYNFDGQPDFSVFEASYAGANTSRVYILKKPGSDQYFISNIEGVSLSFDPQTKTVHEHNSGVSGYIDTTYKLVNNEMKLLSQKCFEYNEQKEDYVEVKCE